MQTWQNFRFHQLIEVPRPADRDPSGERDNTVNALFAALSGAHVALFASGAESPALATAWVRPGPGRPLRLLLGGRPRFPPAVGEDHDSDRRRVLFPPGAIAQDLAASDVEELLGEFPSWVACVGRTDSLWVSNDSKPHTLRKGAFDQYAAHLLIPFAWLVLAEPLQPGQIQPELDKLVNEILPLARGEISEAKKVGLERRQSRHRELSRFAEGGMWRVRLLVGGADSQGAAIAAAMLCAASEMEGLPYVMAAADRTATLANAMHAAAPASFIASTDLLVALTRPPARELAGLRLVQPHSFDVTPEPPEPGGLHLGGVLDEAGDEVGEMVLSRGGLVRHTFVCGATGAGKSHTVRHLLAQASKADLPWLAVEPAKAEYARMAARLAPFGGEVIVLRPSDRDQPPAGLNPLEPAPGFPLQTHADLLRALFLASFEAQEPFPQILAAAIQRCYEELGWDLTLGEPVHAGHQPRYPTLRDLQRTAQAVVDEIGYGQEVSDNVRGFIKVRLHSLRLGTTGRFFEGGHPIDFGKLLTRNVVLEIEDVGDDADKAFLMGIILMRLAEHLRTASHDGDDGSGLRHLTVIEEAHRLLRRPAHGAVGPAAHAVEMFAAMLAEVRAYGEGLIIAEQIPSKLIPDVIKNTAVKIVHRLPAQDDRDSVGATMNLDDKQSKYLVTLRPGDGAAFADEMDRPLLVRVPKGLALESGYAVTAPVTGIIGRRSVTCGRDCDDEPCTLRQMRGAQHLLTAEPWLTIWAELVVVAHLTGHPTPIPHQALLESFNKQSLQPRTVDCALSHAVDDAVAVRSDLLQPTTNPAAFAEHVCDGLRDLLNGREPVCHVDARRYLAAPYRWELVRYALANDGEPFDCPHPRTAEWERQFRRRIPGMTRREQYADVEAWLETERRNPVLRAAVAFGRRTPSAVESAIGATVDGDDWTALFETALSQFVDCDWPLIHLVTPSRPTIE